MSDAIEALARKAAISACASLGVMLVDFFWLLRDEITFVWGDIRRRPLYALVYIIERYVGLVGQGFNVYVSLRIASLLPVPPIYCRIWFVYQAISVQVLLSSMECALIHRIYALFNRNSSILFVLVLFCTFQLLALGASAWLAIPNMQHSETCYVLKTNINTIYFATTTMATHFVMFFMIFWRGVKLPWEWSCSAFGRVVLRDSALSPLIVSLLTFAMVLCNTDVIRTSLNGNIIYYWLFCTMWISLGRIIVNHSKAALLEELKESAGAKRGELTSEIDVGETSSSISESRTSQNPSVDLTSTSEVRIALEALKGRDPSNGAFSFAVAKCGEESPSSGSSDGEDVNP
ncbi:hypothetical protein EDD17DRAFT_1869359 [Pisolithus thermaeus]|nr:hypothetical protein EDD17DRAFT_1869359 [Pisolithus thermaeus]